MIDVDIYNDLDNDLPTFSRVFLIYVDAVKVFFLYQGSDSEIICLSCLQWSSGSFEFIKLTWAFFLFKKNQTVLFPLMDSCCFAQPNAGLLHLHWDLLGLHIGSSSQTADKYQYLWTHMGSKWASNIGPMWVGLQTAWWSCLRLSIWLSQELVHMDKHKQDHLVTRRRACLGPSWLMFLCGAYSTESTFNPGGSHKDMLVGKSDTSITARWTWVVPLIKRTWRQRNWFELAQLFPYMEI